MRSLLVCTGRFCAKFERDERRVHRTAVDINKSSPGKQYVVESDLTHQCGGRTHVSMKAIAQSGFE